MHVEPPGDGHDALAARPSSSERVHFAFRERRSSPSPRVRHDAGLVLDGTLRFVANAEFRLIPRGTQPLEPLPGGRDLLDEGLNASRGRRPRVPPWAPAGLDIEWRTLRDLRARPLLGDRISVVSVRYENPLEVVLAGSGMLSAGVILAARTVRDWSTTRRVGSATARETEAEARMTEARADLYEHLVNEAKRGQTPVPVGDLVQIVTPPEIKSLNRLAERPIALELPRGSDESS